jgi:5-methylcytosine-specific restriction enzyme A
MTAVLLTWKPTQWDHAHLSEVLSRYRDGQVTHSWSCGGSKRIPLGTRVFLSKQGKGARGIFGSGYVVRTPYPAAHYDPEKRRQGQEALFIDVEFDSLSDPMAGGILVPRHELEKLDQRIWDLQGSGKFISAEVAERLEEIWLERANTSIPPLPEELSADEQYSEGAKRRILVNAYERDPRARNKCIEYWGVSCSVCDFHFQYFYGEIGQRFIHVHHLKPLAEIGEEYAVDPIEDLRPVCPNCHAMLHRQTPALSIEELRTLVARYGKAPSSR